MATVATVATLVISAATSAYQINHAKKSAQAAGETRENLLKRKQTDERNTLRENTNRRLDDKKRYLKKLRVQQAASGFVNSGTQLEVFGEIENRLDEGIDEATSQGFTRLNNYDAQIANSQFATQQSNASANLQFAALGVNTAVAGVKGYRDDVDRNGKSAFSIFS